MTDTGTTPDAVDVTALRDLELICGDIYARWDTDQRSGKLLSALAGTMSPGYDPRVDRVRDALTTSEDAVAMPDPEHFLTAHVSQDGSLIGIEHPTTADWHDVRVAHVALRDRINERLEAEDRCPFKPLPSSPADSFLERGICWKRWKGGVSAPYDWNGGRVLLASGEVLHPYQTDEPFDWEHYGSETGMVEPACIVGYIPTAPLPSSPAVAERERIIPLSTLIEAIRDRRDNGGGSASYKQACEHIIEAASILASRPSSDAGAETDQVAIWSGEHRAYWRRGQRGEGASYTLNLDEAGIWTRTEAANLISHCGPEKLIALHDRPERAPLANEVRP